MDSREEVDGDHLMARLQEMVPELRKELEGSIRNRMQSEILKAKESKSKELARMYEQKLRGKVEESNALIRHSLSSLAQMISNYKLSQKVKSRPMNSKEEEEFIEQTVQEILGDENMMDEIRNRFRERIEGKVKQALENELTEGVEKAKKELTLRMTQQREEWTQERIQFWKSESSIELQSLAAEHSELNSRKSLLDSTLSKKKQQKLHLEARLQTITDKNAKICSLRRELKSLKEMKGRIRA